MQLVTETLEKKQSVLIVDPTSFGLAARLKTELKKNDSGIEIFASSQFPQRLGNFDYLFLVNQTGVRSLLEKRADGQVIIFIFIGQKASANQVHAYVKENKIDDVKVILLTTPRITDSDAEKILWFSLSSSAELFLNIQHLMPAATIKKTPRSARKFSFNWQKYATRKFIIRTVVGIFLIIHLSFIIPLIISGGLIYQSAMQLKKQRIEASKNTLSGAKKTLKIARFLYAPARPVYLFLSLALTPDNLFETEEKASNILDSSFRLEENVSHIAQLVFNKDKTAEEKQNLILRLQILGQNIHSMRTDLTTLYQKLPATGERLTRLREQVGVAQDTLSKFEQTIPYLDSILARDSEKTYLLLFANNMELRPGGGFIGSFGTLTVRDLSIQDIRIYDVYDADGQLVAHVEPPTPIKKYLHQPHWFLRDSAFSPDFFDNYQKAKYFLKKEMDLPDFAGSILLTTTAVQNLLGAYGTIYLPDFGETVTADNFYIKAQTHSEQDFFPGSTKKKTFLGAVAKYLIVNIEDAPLIPYAVAIKKSLDEKQMVLAFDDRQIAQEINKLQWSGRLITPTCSDQVPDGSCINDFIFPIDANLGVNKANFYVSRLVTHRVIIQDSGKIENELRVSFKNESIQGVFPGGEYKNYFQLLIPTGAQVQKITQNESPITEYEEVESNYKTVGFFLSIPPQKTTEVRITYRLPQRLKKGINTYQLVVQKQIGSKNSDFVLEILLPQNTTLTNQNFSPLVKDNRIFYNTSLNTDKIFIFTLSKN